MLTGNWVETDIAFIGGEIICEVKNVVERKNRPIVHAGRFVICALPGDATANLQVMSTFGEGSDIAPLEVILHKLVWSPPGLIAFDAVDGNTGNFGMIHSRASEWPRG